jgi:acetyl esterase
MTEYSPSRAAEPDPDVQSFLDLYNGLDIPELHELPPEQARTLFEDFAVASPEIPLPAVEDRTIPGPAGEVPIRVYDPRGATGETPLVVFFHGGGFATGSIDTHDGPCRKLAVETGYPVLSVDYRLAPEHPFPAALRDCYATLEWATESAADLDADPDRLVVAGDSAGGTLAAATALLARNRDGPDIAYQVLVYPVTGDPRETASYEQNADGYFLTADLMDWYRGLYVESDIDEGNVYVRPRLCHDLSGLPPATVLTAGYDPLRDDGAAYAERLAADGVPVSYQNFPGLIHGFFNMISDPVSLTGATTAYDRIAGDLTGALSPGTSG